MESGQLNRVAKLTWKSNVKQESKISKLSFNDHNDPQYKRLVGATQISCLGKQSIMHTSHSSKILRKRNIPF